MSTAPSSLNVVLTAMRLQAQDIVSFELRAADGEDLPPFTAGAHVDVQLGPQLSRSYSLLNTPSERHRYVLAVQLDTQGRGGSRAMHELRLGQHLVISAPRNHFPLVEDAPHTVLIAGGIGITPLWSMAQRLQALGRSWELFYSARTPAHAALQADIAALAPQHVHMHYNQTADGGFLDLEQIIRSQPSGTHFYCCGPGGMLDSFAASAAGLPPEVVHTERFSNQLDLTQAGGFRIELARRGQTLNVPAGTTILATLLEAGIEISHSCLEGICGSCEVKVLVGIPDHRDLVLSPEEQQKNNRLMVCCSGSRSESLTLDL